MFYKKYAHDYLTKCYIKYKIKAYIADETRRDHPIYGKRVLIVNPVLPAFSQSAEVKKTADVKTCCCISNGESTINAFCAKNVFFTNETAQVVAMFDHTKCTQAAEHVSIKLMRSIRTKAGHHHRSDDDKLMGKRYDGLKAGTQETRNLDLPMTTMASDYAVTLSNQPRRNGKVYSNEEIHLATMIQPCVTSKLIQTSYYIQIKTNHGCCDCCRGPPEVKIPMTLVNAVLTQQMTPPPMPQNWAPQQYDAV
jgi:hypothetical protein